MGGAQPTRRVLVIGLDPPRVPGPWDPAPMVAAIRAGMAHCADLGVDAESCLVGLDGSEDVGASIATALRSHPWSCVVVGGGIRAGEGQVELFEDVLDLIGRHAPQAAIAFNSTPTDIAEAALRGLERSRADAPTEEPD